MSRRTTVKERKEWLVRGASLRQWIINYTADQTVINNLPLPHDVTIDRVLIFNDNWRLCFSATELGCFSTNVS